MINKVLSFLLFFPSLAFADTIPGYDVLGLARYCNTFLAAPKLPGLSTLAAPTFGDPLPCVEARIKQGGLELVEVDLRDATCFRNHNCPPGTPSLTDWGVMLKKAQSVNKLAVKYPSIRWWISPYLEHDFKDNATIVKACAVVKKGCPTCKCINTPTSGSARPPGIEIEQHGTRVRSFSVSSDGASMFDADNLSSDGNNFEHRASGKVATFGWFNELNLRCSGEKSFTAPLARTERPTPALFEQAYTVMHPEGPKPPAPSLCGKVRDILKNEINKPNAEHYCNGQKDDGRGNKPLLIVQIPGKRGDQMPIYRADGAKVGAFCYYGPYPAIRGAQRWYVGNCSNETPNQLMKELGSEWGYALYAPGKCLRFNAVRRQGQYR